jgi:peroxiredoxin
VSIIGFLLGRWYRKRKPYPVDAATLGRIMVDVGDAAPDFTAPAVGDDIAPFTFSEREGDGPAVLAFFPGAFTSVCTSEMNSIQSDLAAFEEVGAQVYGISVDTPFALQEFRSQNDLTFPLVSDTNKEIIEAYDVWMSFSDFGYEGVAKRAVFVVDESGEVTYKWVSDDPGAEPDYEAVKEAAEAAA